MFDQDFILVMLIRLPVLVFSLTVHECAHAWTALKFGDSTARDLGRISLNPMRHLELMGSLVFFMSQFTFGWAKPVPVNPWNLRNPRVADIWISAAGPISNLGLAFIFAMLFRLFSGTAFPMHEAMVNFLYSAVLINVALAFFNLIPLFPLDGSHILRNLFPPEFSDKFDQFERYAPFLLLALIIFGGFWLVLGPVIQGTVGLLLGFY